jgi:hypothetical protein
MAAQGSANFADTFNKAVSARTQDLLKNAKQTGQTMTAEQAGNLAFDEIKEWRRNNVDAFKPTNTPEPTAATVPEDIPAPAPVKREPVYKDAGEMRKALVGKVTPDEMDRLVREKFPAVEPFVVDTAKREKFLTNVDNTVEQLKQAREQNKLLFGDNITSANENAGKGSMFGNPKDNPGKKDAVRSMVNNTGQGAVRQANNKISVNKQLYDDLAADAGFTLNWDSAPKVRDMGLAEARKTMSKWMYNEMDRGVPELGLKQRQESMTSYIKREQQKAEKELGLTDEKPAEVNRPISNALQAALDKARANKGNPPLGVMKMVTEENRADFNENVLMNALKGEKDTTKKFTQGDFDITLRNFQKDNGGSYNYESAIHKTEPLGYGIKQQNFPDMDLNQKTITVYNNNKEYVATYNKKINDADDSFKLMDLKVVENIPGKVNNDVLLKYNNGRIMYGKGPLPDVLAELEKVKKLGK